MHQNVAEPGNPYRAPSKSSCSSLSSRPPVYDAKLQNCLAPRSSRADGTDVGNLAESEMSSARYMQNALFGGPAQRITSVL